MYCWKNCSANFGSSFFNWLYWSSAPLRSFNATYASARLKCASLIRFDPDRFLKRRRRFLVTLGPEIDGAEIVVVSPHSQASARASSCTLDRRLELLILV